MAGYKDLLGDMLRMFGQNPEEQTQNIQALLGELRGTNQANKAVAGYTPMMVNMFEQMRRRGSAGQGGGAPSEPPMRVPRDLNPSMIQSLLRSISG